MSDQILEALVKGGAAPDVIELYVKSKKGDSDSLRSNNNVEPVVQKKPKRKLSEKQLAALAAGRAKNPRLIAKQKREAEAAEKQEHENQQEKENQEK